MSLEQMKNLIELCEKYNVQRQFMMVSTDKKSKYNKCNGRY